MTTFNVDINSASSLPSDAPSSSIMHHYGYPAYGSNQIGVIDQWTFDQIPNTDSLVGLMNQIGVVSQLPFGQIDDSPMRILNRVSGGVSLSPTGNPIYNVSAYGEWIHVSPGVENNLNSYFSITVDS
jgi:hypothetical protein